MLLAEPPRPDAEVIEQERHDDGGARSHQGENDHAPPVGLSRGAEQGKGRHVRPQQRHQQDDGTDRAARQEIVLAGATEKPVAE